MHHPPFGHFTRTAIPPPVAGADFTLTVPAGVIWKPVLIHFDLTTDANVIDRYMILTITDGTFNIATFPCHLAQAAVDTVLYTTSAAPASDNLGPSGHRSIPIPTNLWLYPGYTIDSAVLNIQVADQFSIVHILLEEWIQP